MSLPRFELLELLIAAAESRNLYEAARRAGISQPAISNKLRELERQVPLPVFSIEGKRKVLTHYGRALYEMALKEARVRGEEFERLNRAYAAEENLTLRIGARREPFEHLLPRLKFKGRIEFENLSGVESLQALLDHRIDVALTHELPDSAALIAKRVLESHATLAVHRKWLPKGRLDLEVARSREFLEGVPCILYHPDWHLLHKWVSSLGFGLERLRASFVANDWRLMMYAVEQGRGYAIVPNYVTSSDPEVRQLSLPTRVLKGYAFHVLFHRELRQIPVFRRALQI